MEHKVIENGKELVLKYQLVHTYHSNKRAAQRGFNDDQILSAIEFGKAIFKQGLIFYVVLSKLLPEKLNKNLKSKLNNMVVIVANDSNQIITCYKSPEALRHINKKSDYLREKDWINV